MLKIAHIAVSVSSLQNSKVFYRRAFGFRLKEEYRISALGLTVSILNKDEVNLELFEFKNGRPLPKYRRELLSDLKTAGAKHFSFQVQDIAGEYRRLKRVKAGFATDIRVFENGKRYFFIKDPDGALIEIMEA